MQSEERGNPDLPLNHGTLSAPTPESQDGPLGRKPIPPTSHTPAYYKGQSVAPERVNDVVDLL